MKIETCIDSLVSYAMNCGLTQPEDHQVATNKLLELLQLQLEQQLLASFGHHKQQSS